MKTSRGYDPLHWSAENAALIDQIIQHATGGGVAVLDLDGTLFDTRPRQVRIYREYASQNAVPAIFRVEEFHFRDWSIANTLRNATHQETKFLSEFFFSMPAWRHAGRRSQHH